MREILFRGRDGLGVWSVGNLLHLICEIRGEITTEVVKIHPIKINDADFPVVVDPATVGQYTGLTDKNGVKVFEGDVVRAEIISDESCGFIGRVETGVIEYGYGSVELRISDICGLPVYSDFFHATSLGDMDFSLEVIGNIYENPELMEAGYE